MGIQRTYGRFQIGIGVILEQVSNGKILLLQRSEKVDFEIAKWDDIGGRMIHNETPEDTLRREVKEETGINDVNIIKPINVSYYFRGIPNPENETVVINYWCQTSTETITLSEEHYQYKWIIPEEALNLDLHPTLRETILKFLKEREIGRESSIN